MATCREETCRAEVLYARTVKGKPLPLDAQPNPKGNVVIEQSPDPRDEPIARTTLLPPKEGETRWMPHFVTCTNPARFRRVR